MNEHPESRGSCLADRVLSMLSRVEYRLVTSTEERESVFRLRYEAYLREGAISPNAARRMTDADDERGNALIVGVHVDGELASSIRLHVASGASDYLPTAHVFPEMLEPKLQAGASIIDPTRFVADFRMSRLFPELPYITLRVPWMAMNHFGAGIMLAAVRPEHAPFYRRLWGNEVLAPARDYPGLAKPVCLTALDFRARRDAVERRHPFFRSTGAEQAEIFRPLLPGECPTRRVGAADGSVYPAGRKAVAVPL